MFALLVGLWLFGLTNSVVIFAPVYIGYSVVWLNCCGLLGWFVFCLLWLWIVWLVVYCLCLLILLFDVMYLWVVYLVARLSFLVFVLLVFVSVSFVLLVLFIVWNLFGWYIVGSALCTVFYCVCLGIGTSVPCFVCLICLVWIWLLVWLVVIVVYLMRGCPGGGYVVIWMLWCGVLLFLWVAIVWLVTLLILDVLGFTWCCMGFGGVGNGVLLLYLLGFAC